MSILFSSDKASVFSFFKPLISAGLAFSVSGLTLAYLEKTFGIDLNQLSEEAQQLYRAFQEEMTKWQSLAIICMSVFLLGQHDKINALLTDLMQDPLACYQEIVCICNWLFASALSGLFVYEAYEKYSGQQKI